MDLKIEIADALVMKPGDRVLLLVSDQWTQELVAEARRVLGERFPDVTFGFVSGVDKAIVEPGGDCDKASEIYRRLDEQGE